MWLNGSCPWLQTSVLNQRGAKSVPTSLTTEDTVRNSGLEWSTERSSHGVLAWAINMELPCLSQPYRCIHGKRKWGLHVLRALMEIYTRLRRNLNTFTRCSGHEERVAAAQNQDRAIHACFLKRISTQSWTDFLKENAPVSPPMDKNVVF